jgi:hypothetical protein
MMKMKLIGLPTLSVLCVWLFGNGVSAAAIALQNGEAPAPSPLKVSAERITIHDQYATIDAAYPVLSGLKDTAFETALNKLLQEDMVNRVDKMKAEARAEYKAMRADGCPYHGFELSSIVSTSRNDGTLLCFSIRMEFYTGGAHPFPESEFYTILNTVPAKRLALPDLFTDPVKGEARVEKLVQEAFAKNPGDYFDHPEFTADNKTWFYLTDKELHIVFPAYSVAPGCAGEPDIGFDLALFKGVLNPKICQ